MADVAFGNTDDIATIQGVGYSDSSPSGNFAWIWGGPFILSTGGELQSLNAYVSNAGAKFKLALYADNAGEPGALLAVTNELTAAGGERTSGNTTTNPTLSSEASYWIAINCFNTTNLRRKVAAGQKNRYVVANYATAPFPDPPTGTSTYDNYLLAVQAVYTETLQAPYRFKARSTTPGEYRFVSGVMDVLTPDTIVADGVDRGDGVPGTYPTTAASKAAQLADDQGIVLAAAASIKDNATILGQAGTYDFTSAIAAGYNSGYSTGYDTGTAETISLITDILIGAAGEMVVDNTEIQGAFGSSVAGTFDEQARNTDPGESNVRLDETYMIYGVAKSGLLDVEGGTTVIVIEEG